MDAKGYNRLEETLEINLLFPSSLNMVNLDVGNRRGLASQLSCFFVSWNINIKALTFIKFPPVQTMGNSLHTFDLSPTCVTVGS